MKKILLTLILLASVFLKAQINLDSGLVACYPFNAHTVDMINGYNGAGNNIQNANNKNAKPDMAFQLQGVASSYIELPGNNALKANSVSFSAWIKPFVSSTTEMYVLFTRNQSTVSAGNKEAYALMLELTTGGRTLKLVKSNSTQTFTLGSTTILANNNWYHVGFSMDGSVMSLYVNGVQEATLSSPASINYSSGKQVYLGSSNEAGMQKPYFGVIDNVRFYNRLLSPAEVQLLHQNNPSCYNTSQPPVAAFSNWPLCLNQAVPLKDTSANHPESWKWSSPGTIVSSPNDPEASVTFTALGTHTVSLIVENDIGSDTLTKILTVQSPPTIVATNTPVFVGKAMPVTLTATGASSYTWSLSSYTVSGQSVTVTFTAIGMELVTVQGADSMGCLGYDTLYIKVNSIHSTEETDADFESFNFYPNPSSSILSISSKSSQTFGYEVFSVNGKLVLKGKSDDGTLVFVDLRNEPNGIYFLHLQVEGKTITKKIVKSD